MTSAKVNAITQHVLGQIEKLGEISREQLQLRRRSQQLLDEYSKTHAEVLSAREALKSAGAHGVIPEVEFKEVQNALIRLEAEETGISLPLGHPALADSPKPKTLLEVIDGISASIDEPFRADDVRKRLEPYLAALKNKPHSASVSGALKRLADAGKLERVSGGGVGKEVTYKRVEPAGRLVPEGDGNEA